MVNMYDVSMITWVEEMKNYSPNSDQNNPPFNKLNAVYKKQIEHYLKSNYCSDEYHHHVVKICRTLVDYSSFSSVPKQMIDVGFRQSI